MKRKTLLTLIISMVLVLSACGTDDWTKKEDFGEISENNNFIEPTDPKETISLDEEPLNIFYKLKTLESKDYTISAEDCIYYKNQGKIILSGMIHIYNESNVKNIAFEAKNNENEFLGKSSLSIENKGKQEIRFRTELSIPAGYNTDDINLTIFAN